MRVARRPARAPRRARAASDVAAEVERDTLHDLEAWNAHGDHLRLRAAVRRFFLGLGLPWSQDTAQQLRHAVRDLYDRADGKVPRATGARRLTPGRAREVLEGLLLPPRANGRPPGGTPIITDSVTILIALGDGRGVDGLLGDAKIEAQLRKRLADRDYNESEIDDHIADDREALTKAYRRRLRRK